MSERLNTTSLRAWALAGVLGAVALSGPPTLAQDDDLNGLWRRDEDGMVLRIAGQTGDFLNDDRPEWADSPPAFQFIAPLSPGRWSAASQEQFMSTGEVLNTSCTLQVQNVDEFTSACRGRFTVYVNTYRRVQDVGV